jgi:hypothetical protein
VGHGLLPSIIKRQCNVAETISRPKYGRLVTRSDFDAVEIFEIYHQRAILPPYTIGSI